MSGEVAHAHDVTDDSDDISFSPPLYRQRYNLAASILQKAKVTSVCIGLLFCGNVGFIFKINYCCRGLFLSILIAEEQRSEMMM